MHSRHACFTFILTLTCSFVHGSSDVTVGHQYSGGAKNSNLDCLNESANFSSLDSGTNVEGNNTVNTTFSLLNNNNSEVSERQLKMKTSASNVVALLFIPAMWIAGMMPWVLPGIKMVVMFVTMMNNMAFSSALFSLIRGYLFDTRPEDHVIYLNYGYKNGQQQGHNNKNNNEINYANNPYLYAHRPVAG